MLNHPRQVKDEHILENGKLLSDQDIAEIKQLAAEHQLKEGRNTKKELANLQAPCSYSIIFQKIAEQKPKFYAIYKGNKANACLGVGSFGKIKILEDLDEKAEIIDKAWATLKIIPVKKEKDLLKLIQLVEHENLMLNLINHPYHSGLFCRKPDKPTKPLQFELINDYLPEISLLDFINSNDPYYQEIKKNMTECDWLTIMIGMLNEVQRLHQAHFLHRDLKLGNFIYNPQNKKVKIIDFGFSVKSESNLKLRYADQKLLGTPAYIANELYKYSKNNPAFIYSEKSELFALGICFSNLMYFSLIYKRNNEYYSFLSEVNEDAAHNHWLPNIRPFLLEWTRKMTISQDDHVDLSYLINEFETKAADLVSKNKLTGSPL